MKYEKIAKRYAKSLLQLTSGNESLRSQCIEHLYAISELFDNKEIKKVISSPVVPSHVLDSVFEACCEQLKSPSILRQVLKVLVQERRTALIPDLGAVFKHMVYHEKGLVEAELITAVGLQAADLESVRVKLEDILKTKIEINQKVQSDLLGGFVVRFDNQEIDLSLRSKLEKMTKLAVN